jgi:mannosyl-glycoprotein endo-beta-N-acetylglucosaminidase
MFFCILSTILPAGMSAAESSSTIDKHQWYQTDSKTSVYTLENQQVVAQIDKGVKFYIPVSQSQEDKFILGTFENVTYYLNKDSIQLLDDNEIQEEESTYPQENIREFEIGTIVWDEQFAKQSITLVESLPLTVISEEGQAYHVSFFGITGYVKAEDTSLKDEEALNQKDSEHPASNENDEPALEEEDSSPSPEEESKEDNFEIVDESVMDTDPKQESVQTDKVNPEVETASPDTEEDSVKDENADSTTKDAESSTVLFEAQSFTSDSMYFKTNENLVVYDNRSGSLKPIGTLYKGQAYERIGPFGNWHKIRFGDAVGFVYKPSTIPAESTDVPNPNHSPDMTRTFVASANIEVYDNSSGNLVPFATINKGTTYPIIGTMGSWLKVNVAGRLGFIHSSLVKLNFQSTDLYFKPTSSNTAAYDNSTGSLVKAASLELGQSYDIEGKMGNWIKLKMGAKTLYVYSGDAVPSDGSSIKNKNTQGNSSEAFTTINPVSVYDNTSGSLVPFGKLEKGQTVRYISKTGSWYKINFGGRYGFVYEGDTKRPFKATDQFFEVYENNVYVHENIDGHLRKAALLQKGQSYKIVSNFGNWHKIEYGRGSGYVWKESTKPSSLSKTPGYHSETIPATDIDMLAPKDVNIYDNSSGKLVSFAVLKENEYYPIISESGSWWRVSLGNRTGYVYKGDVIVGPIYDYNKYDYSFEEFLSKQMDVKPQTDLYRNDPAYVHKDYVKLSTTTFPTTGIVTTNGLNVREGAGTSYWIFGSLQQGQQIQVVSQKGDWLEIKYNTWRNAKSEDVAYYLNPLNFKQNTPEYFQFLNLSQSGGIREDEINSRILYNKGILTGKGNAFIEASIEHNVNEIYLISHALLETGNGSSELANGILVSSVDGEPVEPKVVYNMFGIGAYDRCAKVCGAETAYKNGWFTPELAIVGGAEFISTKYINHPEYQQNTLFEMRWNPNMPASHQYATDIGWAVKQVYTIKSLYDLIDRYTLYYDVPVFATKY